MRRQTCLDTRQVSPAWHRFSPNDSFVCGFFSFERTGLSAFATSSSVNLIPLSLYVRTTDAPSFPLNAPNLRFYFKSLTLH